MATYLQVNELQESYDAAQIEGRKVTARFDEYDRLADNGINPKLAENYPKVNDGTLAAMLPEDVKRTFSKLYTGKFSDYYRSDAWFDELVNILWTRVLVPGAKTDADFFTKFWNLRYRARKYGGASWFAFFRDDDDYTGADFVLDNPRDVYLEPGKVSATSANYIWRNSYMTKLDLQRLIAAVQAENDDAKKDKTDSFTTWDLDVLTEYLNAGPGGKDYMNKNREEKKKQLESPYFTFATAYHKGSDAPFYTIIPALTGKVARTRKNENPTGAIPIGFDYYLQDLESPTGKGQIQQAGHMQNVLDYMTQADVLATQMGLEPPLKVKGAEASKSGFIKSSIIFAPRQFWELGNADVSAVDLGNSVYDGIQNRMSRYKTNLMTQLGTFDTSAPASAGNPQFSKTPAGVNSLDTRTNVNDNFSSMIGANSFKQLAETLMNIHLANMQDRDPFTLLEDEVERVQKAGWDVGGQKEVTLVWDRMRGKMCFTVDDPSNTNDAETEGLATVIKTLTDPEAVQQIEASGDYRVNLGEAYREYFGKLQLSNLDKIIVPVDAPNSQIANGQQGQTPPAAQAGANGQPQGSPATRPPAAAINYKDAPPDIQAQMEKAEGWTPSPTHAADMQAAMQPPQPPIPAPAAPVTAQHLPITPENAEQLRQEHDTTRQHYGVDEHGAAIIMAARRSGIPEEQIAQGMAAAKANQAKGNQQ